MTGPAGQFTIIVESVLRSHENAATLEVTKYFCQSKGAAVCVESPVGTISFPLTGAGIGPTVFSWVGDPPLELGSYKKILEKGDKFLVQPKFENEIELKPEKCEQLLKA